MPPRQGCSWVLVAGGNLKLGIDFAGGVEALVSIPSEIPSVGDELLKRVATKAALKDAEVVAYSFNTKDEEKGSTAVERKGFFIRSTTQGGAILESADQIKAAIEKELAGKTTIKLWDTNDESGERIRVQLAERADRAIFSRALKSAGIVGGMVSAENEQNNPVFAFSADDSVRLQSLLQEEIKAAGYTGALLSRAKVVRFEKVGATAGQQLRNKGILAVVYALVFILLYIALRFDPRCSPGAIFALFHDVSITLGVFCLTGREFNLPIIAALLAIVGYSLNDTIVVYDRIRENIEESKAGQKLSSLINLSLNECLSRTILTSVTTFLVILTVQTRRARGLPRHLLPTTESNLLPTTESNLLPTMGSNLLPTMESNRAQSLMSMAVRLTGTIRMTIVREHLVASAHGFLKSQLKHRLTVDKPSFSLVWHTLRTKNLAPNLKERANKEALFYKVLLDP